MKITEIPVDMGTDLLPFKLDGCKHMDFAVRANVSRVIWSEGEDPHTFALDVKVICAECGEVMRFRGAKHAITFREPACDVFAWELSAPTEPSGHYDLDLLNALRAVQR